MAQGEEPTTTDRACDRCRERRVKCDKRLPSCLRCEKFGKPCPGYEKKRKFVDEGITLRKKYQATSSRAENVQHVFNSNNEQSPLAGPSSAQHSITSPNEDSVGEVVATETATEHGSSPTSPTFTSQLDTSDFVDPLPFPDLPDDVDTDLILNDILNDPSFDPSWFDIDPSQFYGPTGNSSCGFVPNQPNIIDEVDRDILMQNSIDDTTSPMSGLGFYSDINLWATESQLHTSAIITDEREHEMAFLIRHFTEAIGPWMDLFDQDRHFANLVPLKALRDALLRNAIAAVSAKQLGRVKGAKPYLGVQSQKPASMEIIDDMPEIDWFYKAANYYDKAIAFSRIYLQAISGSMSSPATPNTQMTISKANSDDLLVAVSIFSLYESLDNLDISWLQHLSGLKTLLEAMDNHQQQNPTAELIHAPLTVGRLASFWNFARADYQASYINHQATFLNTEDLQLWHGCGLQIQEDGSLYRDAALITNDPLHCRAIAQLVSHTLLWLVLRVMNYLNSEHDTPTMRQARWLQLTRQLDEWYNTLPQTFQPCAQIRHPLHRKGASSGPQLIEVFFSIDVCAAAFQLYHFTRILLLINRPYQPHEANDKQTSTSGRLKSYRNISDQATKHAHQIVGIALARPHPAVRVEMLLPLYIAGCCLEADEEREIVLELLKAIEKDTGCATENRCKELVTEWGWESKDMRIGMGMQMTAPEISLVA